MPKLLLLNRFFNLTFAVARFLQLFRVLSQWCHLIDEIGQDFCQGTLIRGEERHALSDILAVSSSFSYQLIEEKTAPMAKLHVNSEWISRMQQLNLYVLKFQQLARLLKVIELYGHQKDGAPQRDICQRYWTKMQNSPSSYKKE